MKKIEDIVTIDDNICYDKDWNEIGFVSDQFLTINDEKIDLTKIKIPKSCRELSMYLEKFYEEEQERLENGTFCFEEEYRERTKLD